MVFSSFIFIFYFLPLFLALYFISPARLKNLVVLVFSYLFYAWGAPRLVGLFFISCAADYFLGCLIARSASKRAKNYYLIASLALNLGALFYFKYANFFVGEASRALQHYGFHKLGWAAVALPIGISFFTFHKISYIVDVYRGVVHAAHNFIDYCLYIALFPQLIAGPIIRYHDIADQIERREHSFQRFFSGMQRFAMGLAKKVLLADSMGAVADRVFRLNAEQLSTPWAWIGIVAYAYQIYFDFSGYSDMAIGLGKAMGFDFLENFDRPYISQNFTEFWRRWHISLSRWMRDYLYIPLGGNRGSKLRTYANLWLVFLFSGLWHGANWTFIAWGLYHGFFLVLDKLFWIDYSKRFGRFFNTSLTFILVLIGWVLFRSDSFSQAARFLKYMFNPFGHWHSAAFVASARMLTNHGWFIFALATFLVFLPTLDLHKKIEQAWRSKSDNLAAYWLRFAGALACLVLSVLTLSTTNFTPFIYFKF